MTIPSEVQRQLVASSDNSMCSQVVRLPPSHVAASVGKTRRSARQWTVAEHNRFLEGLERFPNGPWSVIAEYVGTRTTKQTMTHAQKYRQRIARHQDTEQYLASTAVNSNVQTSLDLSCSMPVGHHSPALLGEPWDELDLAILAQILSDSEEGLQSV